MTTDRERVESLFEAALELAPEQRHDFVLASCGTNEALRDAVLGLLSAHAREAGVLDVAPDALFAEPAAPARLGVYRLHGEIGRGGMGVVHDAERDDGQFRRRVAIKIIRQGSDPELLHRILSERQILAGLDHPNIARLLDGGVTPDGRPYLVMEHVDGLPIDVYCERMRLTVTERLVLFTTVARAVEFAHRNLIVHRDLKPSNILVTPDGRPKLLDFGVAKLLHPWMMAEAPMTRERHALTLEYASPEQLRGESLTTTTDVYSLGVVLYELLTGRRPHEEHEHSMAAHAAAVCDGAVERASERVLRSEVIAAAGRERTLDPQFIARARQTTPQRLAKQLHGDIDAILQMALRVEAPRRYGSAELMAQDIERQLSHRPVRAHQGSRGYAFTKLLRRHRFTAVAVVTTLTALLLGAGVAAWQATIAGRERQRAELALRDAEQVAEFLIGLFDSGEQPPQTVSVQDLMNRGTSRIDQLAAQPHVQARVLGAMAAIHEGIGEYERGQQAAEQALEMLRRLGLEESPAGARVLVQLGVLQRRRGEYASAEATLTRAREIQEQVLDPADPEFSITLQHLAGMAVYLGDFEEAERRARAALDLQLRTLGPTHRMRVNMLTQLGAIQRARGDRAGAEETLREAVALRPRAHGSTRREVLNDRLQLATIVFGDPARASEAEAMFRAELPALDPDSPDDVFAISWAESSLADLHSRRGDIATAERLRRHVLDLRRRHVGTDHPATAESAINLGATLVDAGKLDEALTLIQEGTDIYRATLGERHPAYANSLVVLSRMLVRTGDLAAADSAILIALAIRADRYGRETHPYIGALRQRSLVQIRMQRFETAEALLQEGLALAERGGADGARTQLHEAFAELYTAWGRPQDAARHRTLAEAGP
jgi:serine/threonine protein kinase